MKIFTFVKKVFSIGLTILSDLINTSSMNAIPLSCISMTNQDHKLLMLMEMNLLFFYLVLKQVNLVIFNYPYAKMCAPDVIKILNVKVFNLMSRTNETRFIEQHETCKWECKFGKNICNNKQRWYKNKYRCECKELIDKGVCYKGFTWNPRNCECECDRACDIG